MTATPRRSVGARSWMLWSHDQTLGETTLIATGISNGSAAEYLSMIGSRSLRGLLRDEEVELAHASRGQRQDAKPTAM